MSNSESQSENNSINNNNNRNSFNALSSYTKDLKKCFISLKNQNNFTKISKKNTQSSKNTSRRVSKNKIETTQNSKNSKSKIKCQSKSISSTPIEFFMEFREFSEKEQIKKIEKDKEKKIIKEEEEKKKIMKIKKEKKRQKILDLKKQQYDNFWKKVQYYINKKNEHLSQLTYKIKLRNEQKEKSYLSKFKPNKTSILLYPKSRTPLYKYKNINETSLNKELHHFYYFCQKERRNERLKESKTQNSIKYYVYNEDEKNFDSENRYKKFYDNKLVWLKKRDDKINIRKKFLDKEDNNIFQSLSFRPHLEQKSIKLVKKRKNFINFLENQLNSDNIYEKIHDNYDYKNTIYQKYLVAIKPYMNFYFDRKSPYFKRNKSKKKCLTPNSTNRSINIGMIHVDKGNNIRIIKEKKGKNNEQNNKNINKNNNSNKKNIYNIFKPDKKYSKKIKNKEKNEKEENENQNSKVLWWNQIDKINQKDKKKKVFDKYNGLYKVSVRENSSWNKVCVNNIIPKGINKDLIYDFL